MNKLLHISDEELLNVVVQKVKSANSHIKIGARMTYPKATVWKGQHVDHQICADVISLDFHPPHVDLPYKTIYASSLKISFREFDSMEWSSFIGKWLYPYTACVPHRNWMLKHNPGNTVMVLDDQFSASPITLTEKHFADHEYIVFCFGTSD